MKKITRNLFLCLLFLSAVSSAADLNQFFSEQGKNWKINRAADGTIRALYGKGNRVSVSAEIAIQEFLTKYHSLFGIERVSDLHLESIDRSDEGSTYELRQYYKGFPVVGGVVSIQVNRENRITFAASEYKEGLNGTFDFAGTLPTALQTAERSVFGSGKSSPSAQLMVLDSGDHSARPVWRIEVEPTEIYHGSWLCFVDAENPNIVYSVNPTFADFEGSGNVWRQNPVVTPQRTLEKLVNMDGTTKLFGRFERVYDANFKYAVPFGTIDLTRFTTALEPLRIYDYREGDPRLTEAMAYYHINQAHDYWKRLGAKRLNGKLPVFVNVVVKDNGRGYDNAFYSRSSQFRKTGKLVFGSGSVLQNFGLDGDVYYHEYGHAVLDRIKPGFFLSEENNYPDAFHEAFGDIASAAITENPKLAEFALRIKRTHKFIGRNINNNARFPDDVVSRTTGSSEPHHAGLIIGGTWWDLQEKIGIADAHKILLRSVGTLPATEMNFFDLRDAMIAADNNLFNGNHNAAITDSFANHGISGTDPGQTGTINILAVRTARVNFRSGRRSLKTTFKKGDLIEVILNYQGSSNLIPAYNIIPIEVSLSGGTCPQCLLIIHERDEARQGTHTDLDGAVQALIFTDNADSAVYTLTVRSRLGGTDEVGATQTATFTVQ